MKNLFSIAGKTALVTGGSRGIGFMIARGFVEAGATVTIAARKREEVERAVSNVVMGPTFRLPDVHRQDRLCSLEGLDLRFLVEREHHRISRRVHIEPTPSRTLSTNCGSGDILNERVMCGFKPNVRQIRPTIVCDSCRSSMPSSAYSSASPPWVWSPAS